MLLGITSRANSNKQRNKQSFLGGRPRICAEIPRRIKAGERFARVIVDLPRRGCDQSLIDALALMKQEAIAYVSCDPVTLM